MNRFIDDEELGTFTYDDTLWEVVELGTGSKYIHWIGGNQRCQPPKGLLSYASMFRDCKLGEGFTFDACNTRGVGNMGAMFSRCVLPDGFKLPHNFDTTYVTSMRFMFNGCEMPDGFSLGDSFDTANVEHMESMFAHCVMGEGFTLGDRFDTRKVKSMDEMFEKCSFPKGFGLGGLFDMTNVESAQQMFVGATIPAGFSFGNHFDTTNLRYMRAMFADCRMHVQVYPTPTIFIHKDADSENIFADCIITSDDGRRGVMEITAYSGNCDVARIAMQANADSLCDCRKLLDVPSATLAQCHNKEELWALVERINRI